MKAEIIFELKKHTLQAGNLRAIKEKVREFIKGREEKIYAIRIYKEVDIDYQTNFQTDAFKIWDI